MNFDLRTTDSAFSFVKEALGVSGQKFVDEYIVECEGSYEQLWEKHYNRLKIINAAEIPVWAFHITGSLDNCQTIKDEGLRNLHYALSTNSIMAQIFRKYGLEFDVRQKIMYYNGVAYDVDYRKYQLHFNHFGEDQQLKSISYRLCKDYCVNGFMCNDQYLNYGFDVHIRPEFIVDLVNMFPDLSELDLEWRRKSISYKVNFYTYLNQLERCNFDLDEFRDPPYESWYELNDNDKVVKWMLGRAISRAYDELSETYLYVRSDLFVPPDQITDYEKIVF